MINLKTILASLLLLVAVICLPAATHAKTTQDATNDIRVIIDVSGSMKQNDPSNLRVPAMKLLIGLLPPDTYAGIWTFAQQVNMIVTPDLASKQWKKKAVRATTEIHSRGLFTDIEQALNKATWDWNKPSENSQRSIILLTDGVVDVSKRNAESDASRKRILTEVIPRMRAAGAVVHTIALSEHADLKLMKLISVSTDGWQETVTSADQLQRVFLRMFEKSVQPDTVPLENNRFNVDGSISELTVLAFTRADKQPIALISPDKQEHSAAKHSANMRWVDNTGYAMVTIEKPQSGEWQLVADIDPDNRVMVVTDLKLNVAKLPNNLLRGESLYLEAGLTEKNGPITRRDFLDLVTLQLSHQPEEKPPLVSQLVASQDDGLFSMSLRQELESGRNELIISAESPTFKREQRHSLQIHDSPLHSTIVEDPENTAITVNLSAKAELVDPQSLAFSALIIAPDQTQQIAMINKLEAGHWQYTLTDQAPGIHQLKLTVSGKTAQGRDFDLPLPGIHLGTEVAVTESAPEVIEAVEEPVAEPVVVKEAVAETTTETRAIDTILVISIANLLLIIPCIIAFVLWRRSAQVIAPEVS